MRIFWWRGRQICPLCMRLRHINLVRIRTDLNMETIPKRGQTDCLVSNDLARRREPFKR